MTETTLGVSASDFYQERTSSRATAVQMARRMADLTTPSLFPPEEYETGEPLRAMNQSINSRAVNTLAAKLTQVALPPNLPFIKYNPIEGKMQEDIKADPELWGEVQYALSRREQMHRERLETTGARSCYGRSIKQLLVTGNVCCLWTDIENPQVRKMHHYVVKRSATGTPLITVIEDEIAVAEAEDDVLDAYREHTAQVNKHSLRNDWEDTIKIYHVQKLVVEDGERQWLYWQEVEGGHVIRDTEAWAPYEVPHMFPAGLIPEEGSDWYMPYCFDYEGDLSAVETFAASIQDAAAAMAWFLFFVNPTGHTKIKDVQEADSLAVLPGRADDVTSLTTQKGGDISVVSQEFQEASRRLGYAFAMHTSIQRPGERVTREEWVQMATELNQTMGGLYSDLAFGFQRWFVLRFIHLHEETDKSLSKLPGDLIRVGVVTGIENIGQDTDLTNLKGLVGDVIEAGGPEAVMQVFDVKALTLRLASLRAVKTEGLIKTSEQADAEQQQATDMQQQQTMLEQATGPLAKEGGSALKELMMQKINQGEANG